MISTNMSPRQVFIIRYRTAVRKFIDALRELLDLRDEFIYMDYSTGLTDADFTTETESAYLVKQDLLDASAVVDAINMALAANSAAFWKRLYRVRRLL